jgi:1-phosphofructokinase family hexose kinase
MIGALSLSPAIDKIVSLRNLKWGEHIRVNRVAEIAAGKGINCARVIKKLGGEVVVIGVIGGPNGEWIKSELKKENIRFDFIPIKENTRQSLTIMDIGRKKEMHLREEPAAIDKKEIERVKRKLRKWAPGLDFFVISGRLPEGVSQDFYKEVIFFLKKRGIPVLLDSNGPAFAKGVEAMPDYIKPNMQELEELAGRNLRNRYERIKFMKCLMERGIKGVFVTDGPGNVLALRQDLGAIITPPIIHPANTVGSGDAVAGAIAYGMTEGLEYERMLKLAVACGSANAVSRGAGFLDMATVKKFLKKIDVKVLYNHGN